MLLFSHFLFLFIGGGGAEIFVSQPVPIVNGRSLRVDTSFGPGHTYARVERVIACSAIDMPFFEYDPRQPETSGCNSSGYAALEIYSRDIALNPAGSLASKFRVRMKQNTILMRRHLLDRRAPLVRLQVHFSTAAAATAESIVKTVYYRVDELVLPIDTNQTGRFSVGPGEGGGKNVFGSAIADNGIDDDLQYTGVANGSRDPLWYTQTLGMMFIFAFGVCVALFIWYRVSKKSAKHPRGTCDGGGSYQQNHYDMIASFLNKASVIGLFSAQDSPPRQSNV